MNRYMLEEFHSNPALFRKLAEREQARALRNGLVWLVGKFAVLAAQVWARLKPGHPGRWIARLG